MMGDGARPFSDREGEGSTECSALRRADRFALYFVECNASAFCQTGANALRERLDRPVMDVEIGDVERSPTRPAIDFVLEQRLLGVPDEVVAFVWGQSSFAVHGEWGGSGPAHHPQRSELAP